MTCQTCAGVYEPREGRGRQSPYCPICRKRRERAMTGIRQLRHTNTTINEWIEALGPTILGWKEAMTEKQNGNCLRCGKHARLYFALSPEESLIGLCAKCHGLWIDQRRGASHRRTLRAR